MSVAAEQTAPVAQRLDPDVSFLVTAHQANLAQIALGQIAAKRGTSPTVRSLGARFAADSTKHDIGVQSVAKALRVPLESTPNATVRQSILAYQSASTAAFDTLFLTSQTALHAQADRLVRTELADGDEALVRKIAASSLPVIKQHTAQLALASRR
ncbi:DUF4142 domain-containing protein [Actinoplanes regularis]|uniref:DUF4142 domain-containing protein n=1 Tax=Actinoplanes regularis TaxID=52697 RepID=UPI00255638F6|nr:DUF4142 domain-containing protein [Actinoplanes regularis]